jgi:hypothetical protein
MNIAKARSPEEGAAAQAWQRRVHALHLRGIPAGRIAATLHAERSAVEEALRAIAAEEVAGVPLVQERTRLLAAAQAVEAEAWSLFHQLPGIDTSGRLAALNTVLAAQAQAAELLNTLGHETAIDELAALGKQFLTLLKDGKVLLAGAYDGRSGADDGLLDRLATRRNISP